MPLQVIGRPAEIGQAYCGRVDLVQPRDRLRHGGEYRRPVGRCDAWQPRIKEDPAGYELGTIVQQNAFGKIRFALESSGRTYDGSSR